MEALPRPGRRLALRLLTTGSALVLAITLGARWLTPDQQDWLMLGCTVIGVLVGASLFWLTDRGLGWVGAAALLLALAPQVVHQATSDVLLGSRGRLDQCLVTSVHGRSGTTDVLPTIEYEQQLECAASGTRQMQLSHPAALTGTTVSVWLDAAARLNPVTVRDARAPGAGASIAVALAVLLGLVISGAVAARRIGGLPHPP